ncbi:MAG: MATE family efflux transporter [Desulfovibrio sp.]|nr:MATE family efflux transporter [Desulfovibrio sp.]
MSCFFSFRKELPFIFPLFGPLLVSQYAQIGLGAVDTAMAARLGTVELGSVAVGVALWMPVYMFTIGIVYASLILVSQHNGAGDDDGTRFTAQQGAWLGLLLGLLSAGLVYLLSLRIDLFGASAEMILPAQEYLRALLWGLPFGSMALGLRFYCEGQNTVFPVTVMILVMVGLGAFLNYGLMFGNFGLPALGLYGCGLATALSMACFFCMLCLYVRFSPKFAPKGFFRRISLPDPRGMLRIFKLGLPLGFGATSEFLIFSVIVMFISTRGAAATAAHQIAFTCMMLLFATPAALSFAASIRVGNLYGLGDRQALRQAITGILTLSGLLGLAFTLVLLLNANGMARAFSDDAAVIPLAASILQVAAFFQFADAMQVCLNGTLRGAGDTTIPFVMTIVTYWLFCLPSGYALSGMPLPFNLTLSQDFLGIRGWWVALTISISLVAILLAFRVYSIFWKVPNTIENEHTDHIF